MRKFGNNGGSLHGIFAPADHNHNHVSVGIRSGASHKQQSRYSHHHHHRRLVKGRKISIVGALILFLVVAFIASIAAFLFLSSRDKGSNSPLPPFNFLYISVISMYLNRIYERLGRKRSFLKYAGVNCNFY